MTIRPGPELGHHQVQKQLQETESPVLFLQDEDTV